MNPLPYTEQQNDMLIALLKMGTDTETIARVIGRSVDSVRVKASKLRSEGKVDRLPGRPAPTPAGRQAASDPGINLNNDEQLVRRCREQGSFPQALSLNGRTFWIKQDGSQWVHTPSVKTRLAA